LNIPRKIIVALILTILNNFYYKSK